MSAARPVRADRPSAIVMTEQNPAPALSVLVPTHGRGATLANLLERLAGQTLAPDRFEVVVVDDGSPEPVRPDAAGLPFALTLLRQENAGPAAARNHGLEHCRAPLVLILNDDAVPAPDLLERHLAAHAEAPERCAVLGTFRFTEEARRDAFVRLLDETDLLFSFSKLEHGRTLPWQFFWTCNISLPVEAIRAVGGFDQALFRDAIMEDVELGYRLEKAGWRVLHREDCRAEHDHVLTPADYLARAERLGFNAVEMYRKHRDSAVLWCPDDATVERVLQRSVAVVETLRSGVEPLERALAQLQRDYADRPIPAATRQQAHDLVRRVMTVPLHRGIHRALHGFDPLSIVESGAPRGTTVSVVVVSRDALANTQRCIEALRAAREEAYPMEILVVDNGSTDGSAEWLAEQEDLQVISNSENHGAPRARNQAIPRCTGDWIAFLDNDVFVPPGWLGRALYHGAVDPCVGAVALVANRASKLQQVEYDGGDSPAAIDVWARKHFARKTRDGVDADLFTSLAVLVRRDVIDRIGGFDERFSPWGFEDDDLALRIRLAGWRNRVARDTFVYHAPYPDAEKHRRHSAWMHDNWERFSAKWGRPGPSPAIFDYAALRLDEIGEVDEARLVFPIPRPDAAAPRWRDATPQVSAASPKPEPPPALPAGSVTAVRPRLEARTEADSTPPARENAPDARRNVVVLGSGRSGTSMLAGTLAAAGWDVGGEPYPARDANPKGFFETPEVNGVNEYLLSAVASGAPTLGAMQRWLAAPKGALDFDVDEELRARMERLAARAPFVFKDPRFSHTLPAWRPSLGDARFVCIFREPAVTAESIVRECSSADYLAGLDVDFERAVEVWYESYARIVSEHRHEGEWLFLHAEQLLTPAGIARLEDFVGGAVRADFPEARLQRTKSERPVPAAAGALYRELCTLAGMPARELAEVAPPAPVAAVERPELTVLVCTYQRLETLRRCLASFEAQTAAGRFELVVVDDGSTDGTAEFLADWRPTVPARVVRRENGGLSAARNSGLEVARGGLVLLVNDDTIAAPDLVAAHLRAHAEYGPDRAILGTFEQPAEALDNALMRVLERSQLVFCYANLPAGKPLDWTRFWTCNVSVSTESVRAVGGFDESFRHYGCEDADLGVRLERERGVRVVFDPRARAEHEHLLDFDDLRRRNRMVARAFVRLFRKHPGCLDHPDWRDRRRNTVAGHEGHLVRVLPERARAEAFARELSRIDLGALERGGPEGVRMAHVIAQQLEAYLGGLNELWWAEGEARGLREFDLAGYGELELGTAVHDVPAPLPAARTTLQPIATPAAGDSPETDWPLATQAVERFLAWPRYDRDEDLEELFRVWGPELVDHPDRCLCLRHDPDRDGDLPRAIERVTEIFGRVIGDGRDLELLIVDGAIDDADLPRLGRAVTAVLELSGSEIGPRAGFAEEVGAPLLSLSQGAARGS